VPIYFNLYSARHFEPDKVAALRALAIIGAAASIVWLIDYLSQNQTERNGNRNSWWKTMTTFPLFWPTVAYTTVFVVTTITSVVPTTSIWGSYQRAQGLYTYLAYLILGGLVATMMRTSAQRERFITLSLAAATMISIYGIMQHFRLDPLQWRDDVSIRVASTMGNPIFVAAYLIMIIPLALYRLIAALIVARSAPLPDHPAPEWRWAIAQGSLWLSGLLLIIAMLKFSGATRLPDFRNWWILPGAIICATILWWLLTTNRHQPLPRWPLGPIFAYVLGFALAFARNNTDNVQQFVPANLATNARDWWLWLILAIITLIIGYGLRLTGNAPERPSRLTWQLNAAAYAIVLTMAVVAIFFSQSRGPWIGLGSGLFLFFFLILWHGRRWLQASGHIRGSRLLSQALVGWIGLTLLVGGFLIIFNLSDAPFFARLREIPYVGRMGQLLEIESGTGLVRRLIWIGDEHTGGTIGLITSDPLRLLIGWGPESMFVAFNRFYPPSLANIEARGASPDRAHQALLDEIVTKGLLGLTTYFWLIGSFVWFVLRRLNQPALWQHHLLLIATLSAITAHVVEGMTGIPITSTLLMFWLFIGLTIAAAQIEQNQEITPVIGATSVSNKLTRRQSVSRSKPQALVRHRPPTDTLVLTSLVGVITTIVIWWSVIQPIYADMRFQRGQQFFGQGQTSVQTLSAAINDYIAAIRSNPSEDFYYINLARCLITLAETIFRQSLQLGDATPANFDTLLKLDTFESVVGFVQRSSPLSLLTYAETTLLHAHQLNPLNKDHYANLGRLNTFWYNWTGDVQRLHTALDWYERVATIAPQDVVLINERARVLMQLAEYATKNGEAIKAESLFQQAEELLQVSARLDPLFSDTTFQRGNLIRLRGGDLDAVTALYEQAIEHAPQQMADQIDRMIGELSSRPDLLNRLRAAFTTQADRVAQDQTGIAAKLYTAIARLARQTNDLTGAAEAYAHAVAAQPTDPVLSEQYTLVLSEMLQYDAALAEAHRMLAFLQGSGNTEGLARVEQLITQIEQVR